MLSSIGKSFKIFPYQEISGIPNILKFFFLFVVQLSQPVSIQRGVYRIQNGRVHGDGRKCRAMGREGHANGTSSRPILGPNDRAK